MERDWRPDWPRELGHCLLLLVQLRRARTFRGSRARRAQSQPLPREARQERLPALPPTPPSPLPGSSSPTPGHHRLNLSPSPHFRGPQIWPPPDVTSLQCSGTRAGAHVSILRQMTLEKSAPPMLFPPIFHFQLFSASPPTMTLVPYHLHLFP